MNHRNSSRASKRNSAGFIQLDGGSQVDMTERDIPLTNVQSYASTGARKNAAGAASHAHNDSTDSNGEKAGHHGRRKKVAPDGLKRKGTGDEVERNALGRLYERIVGFSVLTRYMVYVVPVGILLAIPLIVLKVTGHRNDINVGTGPGQDGADKHGPTLFNIFFWLEITWLTLWAAKLAALLLPQIFMALCGIVSAGVRKYAAVLRNMVIPFSLFFWALATWITFQNLFSEAIGPRRIQWCMNLERVLGATFVSSAVFLGEKAIIQLIGVSYHQRSFALRIKESKREIRLLGLLYEASRTLFPMYCREFADEDYVIDDSIEMMLRKKAGHKRRGSATPMKLIGDVGRIGDKVTSVFGNLASEITGKQVFNPHSSHTVVIEALEKRLPSEALARRIWMSFVVEGKEALYIEDFYEVLGPAYSTEAEEAFAVYDADLNGDISLDEMVRKTVEIGQERKAIAEGMKDIGQALRVLDKVLLFIVLLIVVFIFLAFFSSRIVTVIGTAGTALLSLSFVFAVTTQEFLGSCIFLFVKHPFDVGDRVDIGGSQMVVERISLLYSVFRRLEKSQITQVPNIQLNNLWIDNISRSKAMSETIELNVSYDTSFEDVELLRLEMEKFVRHPDNSRDFHPDFSIGIGGVGNLDKMLLYITIKHKSNWHNDKVRSTRRSKFMCALAVALKKVPIYAPGGGSEALGGPGNPSYSVAVSDEFAAAGRDKYAKDKEAARMVPSDPAQTEKEAAAAEQAAISELNTVPLAIDTTTSMWEHRDDNTSSAVDESGDPRRSREIEAIRSELHKKESQRGRRKAGEGLTGATGLTPTDGHFPPQQRSPRLETFDEEATTDMPSTFYERNHPVDRSNLGGHSHGGFQNVRIDDEEEPRRSTSLHVGSHPVGRRPSRGPSPANFR
ncbi:serine/threonine protein kinase [Cordyceps fumosorosea ARSEF 2679]|uniref:Mechanosensitive ion channel protein n=1 Tax=Cordyceps fumosorosea (strain ARSEF 2679) TaxID=1081104 RepID=A0A167S5V3_CORFA|nr:serine/threonine protein kinase [Cordyceps fumosorosea ARSEF 2679]OAA59287.1 serine/threonine protein kinase [Cordyceps fumosorosea ARSEF 2679]